MTIEIKIYADPSIPGSLPVDEQIRAALAAIGYVPKGGEEAMHPWLERMEENFKRIIGDPNVERAETPGEPEPATTPAPAEKKTRSRKAKDAPAVSVSSADAADAAADNYVADVQANPDVPNHAISTGEERIGPEDSPEVVAQDEADEKAESDAARDPEKPLTLDDVRVAMGAYATAYGMDAALADGPAIYNKALGPVPDGTKNAKGEVVKEWCLTATPLDQESLGKAVQYWQAALTENPFKHTKVAA